MDTALHHPIFCDQSLMDLCVWGLSRSISTELSMTLPLYLANLITRFIVEIQWITSDLINFYSATLSQRRLIESTDEIPPEVYTRLGSFTWLRMESTWVLPTVAKGTGGDIEYPGDYCVSTFFNVQPLSLDVVPLAYMSPHIVLGIELLDRSKHQDDYVCHSRGSGYFQWQMSNVAFVREIDGERVPQYLDPEDQKHLQRPWTLKLYLRKQITGEHVSDFEMIDPMKENRFGIFVKYKSTGEDKKSTACLSVCVGEGEEYLITEVELKEDSQYHLRWTILGLKCIKDISIKYNSKLYNV
jgi:hypothetical protein